MSKHPHHTKAHSNNRVSTSISVDPERPNQGEGQVASEIGFVPSYEDIQKRAYHIHEERGGSDLENWLEAERDLKEASGFFNPSK